MSQFNQSDDQWLQDQYQQRKEQHKMPQDLHASLHSSIDEQLSQQQANKGLWSKLRHPALTMAFSVTLVFGLLINYWSELGSQVNGPQLDYKPLQEAMTTDMGKTEIHYEQHKAKSTPVAITSDNQQPPPSWNYVTELAEKSSQIDNQAKRKEQSQRLRQVAKLAAEQNINDSMQDEQVDAKQLLAEQKQSQPRQYSSAQGVTAEQSHSAKTQIDAMANMGASQNQYQTISVKVLTVNNNQLLLKQLCQPHYYYLTDDKYKQDDKLQLQLPTALTEQTNTSPESAINIDPHIIKVEIDNKITTECH